MKYKKTDIANIFLYDTKIENLFINEYMLTAPGEYVKVYLLGCMFAESNTPIENSLLAKQLNTTEDEIVKAWKFWEGNGVVKIKGKNGANKERTVEILNLKEIMFNGAITLDIDENNPDSLNNKTVEEIIKAIEKNWGAILDANELEHIASWPEFYHIAPEIVLFGINYCTEKNKKNVHYLEKVIQGWINNNCKTIEDVQNHLDEVDQKYYRYRRVLKALGLTRNATEAERRMMDAWFDEMQFTMDKVLSACEKTCGITNPNLNYINTVLQNWAKEAKDAGVDVNKKKIVNRATINEYLQYLRDKEEKEADERKKEVYKKVPKIKKLDMEISDLGAAMSKSIVTGNTEEASKIKTQIDDLMAERAITLTDNNYEVDYTDIKYACDICKDTGITDNGEKCQCMNKRTEEAEGWANLKK